MNMPGAYLVEWSAIHTLGPGAGAWRAFDLLLLLAGAAAMVLLTVPGDLFAGVFAASLFAVIHLLDGLEQAGQRDLTIAVLLLVAAACAVRALRLPRSALAWSAGCGLSLGLAITIKPTALLFALLLGSIVIFHVHRSRVRLSRAGIFAVGASTLAVPLLVLVLLIHVHAVAAFWSTLRDVLPFYASLGHRPLSFLLAHCLSPVVPLAAVWTGVLFLRRPALRLERSILLAGVLFGIVSYFAQARGFPYHRYPLLIFFLSLAALDLAEALPHQLGRDSSHPYPLRLRAAQALAALGLAGTALVIAPVSTRIVHRYEWRQTPFEDSLEHRLHELGGDRLSGRVQCIDWVSGCDTTLLRMHLVSSTGVLTDFLLFGPERLPAVRAARATLEAKLATDPPDVIIVSSFLHLVGLENYRKLALWPGFGATLDHDYTLQTEWAPQQPIVWVGRHPQWPKGYRIYVRRGFKPQMPVLN